MSGCAACGRQIEGRLAVPPTPTCREHEVGICMACRRRVRIYGPILVKYAQRDRLEAERRPTLVVAR